MEHVTTLVQPSDLLFELIVAQTDQAPLVCLDDDLLFVARDCNSRLGGASDSEEAWS